MKAGSLAVAIEGSRDEGNPKEHNQNQNSAGVAGIQPMITRLLREHLVTESGFWLEGLVLMLGG